MHLSFTQPQLLWTKLQFLIKTADVFVGNDHDIDLPMSTRLPIIEESNVNIAQLYMQCYCHSRNW